jgi:hypothetical protein
LTLAKHNLSTRRSSLDWESMALLVWREMNGNKAPMTPAEMVERISLKLAVVGSEFTSGDIARGVLAQGDGRYWHWYGEVGRWMVRRR